MPARESFGMSGGASPRGVPSCQRDRCARPPSAACSRSVTRLLTYIGRAVRRCWRRAGPRTIQTPD
jgi:hypothetical protein